MGRHQLHAVDKAIKFLQTNTKEPHYCIELPKKPLDPDLAEEHDIPAPPDRTFGLVTQNRQGVAEEQVFDEENDEAQDDTDAQQDEYTGHSRHSQRPRLGDVGGELEAG